MTHAAAEMDLDAVKKPVFGQFRRPFWRLRWIAGGRQKIAALHFVAKIRQMTFPGCKSSGKLWKIGNGSGTIGPSLLEDFSLGHANLANREVPGLRWSGIQVSVSFLTPFWEVLVKTKMQPLTVNCERSPIAFAKKPGVIATGIAISLMAGQYAYAQERVEKIEVTGTRIPPKNLESTSPVNIVSSEDVKMEGVRTIESLLNTLPQVFADQGQQISNGASGTATVSLRGLGPDRTLVLMNGKRLPPGSPILGAYAADVNQIPAALISRVEILTGGAGAVYGADAVAGVINFVMNDRFQGVQLEYNNSFYNHHQQNDAGVADIVAGRAVTNPAQFKVPGDVGSDGKTNNMSLTMGSNFADGRGNATLFFSYQHTDPIFQAARDFSSCSTGSAATAAAPGGVLRCGGSSTSYPGRFILNGGTGSSITIADAAGNTRAFNAALDQYNFAPTNFFQRPDVRYAFNAFAHYDINSHAKVYSEFGFLDDHTVAQIAPSGLFGVIQTLYYENPFLSQGFKNAAGLTAPGTTSQVDILRRNVEGGGRQDDIRNTKFRGILGVKGDINKTWQYDAFMQWGQDVYQETYLNELSKSRSTLAIDVINNPGAGGAPACRTVVAGTDTSGCVPYNIFQLGGVTPTALGYVATPGLKKGQTTQSIQSAFVTGDLGDYGMRSPMAKEGVQVVAGGEYRKESLTLNNDVEFSSFDLAGQGGPTLDVNGGQSFKDVFMEVRAPLIEGREFAKLLELNGSYRHSEISTGKIANSYGGGVKWTPIDQVTLRGTYQRAVRAPNIIDLFVPQGLNLFNLTSDPCAGAAPTATLAQCQKQGVTAAQYGNILQSPAGQYNQITGGNPNLRPESADTYTVGVVLTPIKSLNVTVDYWNIRIKDTISAGIPPGLSVANCVATGDPIFCSLITRDATGSLWLIPTAHVLATNLNIGSTKTSGIDVGAGYTYRIAGYGALNFDLNGVWTQKAETTPIPGQGTFDCVGLHGGTCGVPTPKWKSKAYVNWTSPWNFSIRGTWRHIGSVDNEGTSNNAQLNNPGLLPIDAHFTSRDYFDLAGSWNVTKMLTMRAGVTNLFDKDPPIANSSTLAAVFGNGNTYPAVYDSLGRLIFVTATAKF